MASALSFGSPGPWESGPLPQHRAGSLSDILSLASRDPATAMRASEEFEASSLSLRDIAVMSIRRGEIPGLDRLFNSKLNDINSELDSLHLSRVHDMASLGFTEDEIDVQAHVAVCPPRRPSTRAFANMTNGGSHTESHAAEPEPPLPWNATGRPQAPQIVPVPPATAPRVSRAVPQRATPEQRNDGRAATEEKRAALSQLSRALAANTSAPRAVGLQSSMAPPPSSSSLWQLAEEEEDEEEDEDALPNAVLAHGRSGLAGPSLRSHPSSRSSVPASPPPPSSLWDVAGEDEEEKAGGLAPAAPGDQLDQPEQTSLGYVVKNTFIEFQDASIGNQARAGLSAALFRSEPPKRSQ